MKENDVMSGEKENQSPNLERKESAPLIFNTFFISVREIGGNIEKTQAEFNAEEVAFQAELKRLETERLNTFRKPK